MSAQIDPSTRAGHALSYWLRRRPVARRSAVSAIWVYSSGYLVGGGHAPMLADHANGHSAAFSGNRLVVVWLGLPVLVGTQIWDLVVLRRTRVDQAACSDPARP